MGLKKSSAAATINGWSTLSTGDVDHGVGRGDPAAPRSGRLEAFLGRHRILAALLGWAAEKRMIFPIAGKSRKSKTISANSGFGSVKGGKGEIGLKREKAARCIDLAKYVSAGKARGSDPNGMVYEEEACGERGLTVDRGAIVDTAPSAWVSCSA
ncbi:unnamed protein product [Ostreobium quekettii]|uniref:Uncharacterized protein n=1 Tax=Ostreobium quekettii TaxID=121088 RepID=A0A8S1JHM1_9CHLO|nr:unnamed protein product [Ostreobium quekettii]|eukprot:evm.model.scf_1629.2 EVM.evm.TU.scf_1629.2   scf_1629:16236-16700(-)